MWEEIPSFHWRTDEQQGAALPPADAHFFRVELLHSPLHADLQSQFFTIFQTEIARNQECPTEHVQTFQRSSLSEFEKKEERRLPASRRHILEAFEVYS